MEWLKDKWYLCVDYYHVDPIIFLSLYIPKSFIYWWTIFRIVACLRSRQNHRVPALVVLNVTTNISPWVYVYVFGDNLPWWYPLWFVAVLGLTLIYLGRTVRKRMLQPGPKEQAEHE